MIARLNATASIVLGANGYIGQALVRRLLERGQAPLVLADLQEPRGYRLSPFDPAGFGQAGSRQFYRVDLTDPEATARLLLQVRRVWPGHLVVYHLAGLFVKDAARRAQVQPDEYRRHNVDTLRTVLAGLEAAGPPFRLVFQSAAGIERWSEEQAIPDPYLRSKRDAERVLSQADWAEWVVLRPVRVIGLDGAYRPHRRPGRWPVLAGLREARACGRIPPDVLSDLIIGGSWRSERLEIRLSAANGHIAYVHLNDAVSALLAAGSPATPPGAAYRVTTVPALTFADMGEIMVQELESVGTRAALSCEYVDDPILLSPAYSPGFSWRPLLERSRDAVRAALWQYLDAAEQCVRPSRPAEPVSLATMPT
jgi:nucleoside-diphosphate-sugar epimerase